MRVKSSNKYSAFFSHLASPLRADILSALKANESGMSVGELAQVLRIEQSKLSHALSSLRGCNIVQVKVSGKQRIYSLNRKTIIPLLQIIDNHAKSYCSNKCWACIGCSN